jgi:multiple sugar transport system permease protein
MTVRTHRARGRRGGPSPYPTRAARGWRSFGAAFVVLVFVPPLLLLVGGSLRQPGLPPPPRPELIPDPISTEGYATALNLGGLLRASVNSLVVVAIAVPVSVLVAALARFALTRVSRRLAGAVAAASLMAPALGLLLLRDTIASFQVSFVPALVVTEGGPPPYATTYLSLFVYRNAFEYLRYGYAAAATLVMLALTLIAVAVQLRLIRRAQRVYGL